jgi:hypothetical protein
MIYSDSALTKNRRLPLPPLACGRHSTGICFQNCFSVFRLTTGRRNAPPILCPPETELPAGALIFSLQISAKPVDLGSTAGRGALRGERQFQRRKPVAWKVRLSWE